MAVVYFIVHGPDREITIRENYILHSSLNGSVRAVRGVGLKKRAKSSEWTGILPGKTANKNRREAGNQRSK